MSTKVLIVWLICSFFPFAIVKAQQTVWLAGDSLHNLRQLSAYISQAPYLGLEERDYDPEFIRAAISGMLPMPAAADSLAAEARITHTAIQFFTHIAYGRLHSSPVRFNGPAYQPRCKEDIAAGLAVSLQAGRFGSFLQETEPATPEYIAVKHKLALYYHRITDSAFKDVRVTSLKVDTTNKPLLLRLHQMGILDSIAGPLTPHALQEKLRAAQRMFNLLDDGSLRASVVKALNVPFAVRLKELDRALNQLRWLHCCRQEADMVVVNIPSADLVLYQDGKAALYSRVVVGKRSARTPTLCSRITEVILYPYWMVPHKIATRELLPHIKRNIGYLEANQFEVLDRRGRVVSPASIDWQSLSAQHFPYVIRQGTGCDNSLGIVKLNFYSPFTVFLHDTPWKGLFMLNQRFFSHGCIRVEEALGLSRLLLKDGAAEMDALIEKGCLPDQQPVPIAVKTPAFVFVLYNTAWPDAAGNVRFYGDVYAAN